MCIVDGLGSNPSESGNATKGMTNLERAISLYPNTLLKASGPEVGLVDAKDAGNSEVGHNAIGAGQYIKQGLALLNDAFATGAVFDNNTWRDLVANAKKEGRKINIIVCLSDGRIHSDIQHLFKVLNQCAKEKVTVSIHALLDGRDVSPQSAMKYIKQTRDEIAKCGVNARIATVGGRGVLWMDRYETDTRVVTNGFGICVQGNTKVVSNIEEALNAEYRLKPSMTDETMPPFILEPDYLIKNSDSVLLLNYRGDRAIEMCNMFDKGTYLNNDQYYLIKNCLFAGMLLYDAELGIPKKFLCPPASITNGLTEHLCKHGVRQFTITETIKFGHLTYFFNGNKSTPFDPKLETWKEIIANPKPLKEAPEMRAREITDGACYAIKTDKYDFIKLNLVNPDIVGHTADYAAAFLACKVVDECLGRLIECCKSVNAKLIITGDHGNAEEMLDAEGKPRSSHTNNPVPFILIGAGSIALNKMMGLTNIAATICKLLGVPVHPKFNPSII